MRQLVQATIALFKLGNSLLMVCSIVKSGFRFKIQISDLQSNGKSENGFQRWDICFWFSFLLFDWEIRRRIWKTVVKNSGLARPRILSKKKTTVHENSFANPFFGFPNGTVKRKSMKSEFGFLNWNLPCGRISRRWNPFSDFAFDWEIQI